MLNELDKELEKHQGTPIRKGYADDVLEYSCKAGECGEDAGNINPVYRENYS